MYSYGSENTCFKANYAGERRRLNKRIWCLMEGLSYLDTVYSWIGTVEKAEGLDSELTYPMAWFSRLLGQRAMQNAGILISHNRPLCRIT